MGHSTPTSTTRARRVGGVLSTLTPVLLNEGATPDWSGLYHYYHFAVENLLGGLAALGSVHDGAGVPDRLVMPWDQNWHDKWTMNEMIVGAMFEEVVDAHAWESIRQGNAFFEEGG